MTEKYMAMTAHSVPGTKMTTKKVDVKKEIKGQIEGALANAKFPIKTPKDLLGAFPNGADTTCQAGDVKMTAGEAGKLLKSEDFPFNSATQVADTILKRAGM